MVGALAGRKGATGTGVKGDPGVFSFSFSFSEHNEFELPRSVLETRLCDGSAE